MAAQLGFAEVLQWRCPICVRLPPKEIYQCMNGHSICGSCASRVYDCPSCRVEIGRHKVRNLGLEGLLDGLRLQCSWNGCDAQLSRRDISQHEETCPRNPDALNICRYISASYVNCNFTVTMESLQNVRKIEQVIDHLKSCHGVQEQIFELGDPVTFVLNLDALKARDPNSPHRYSHGYKYVVQIFTMNYQNKKHFFLQMLNIYMDTYRQKEMLSLMLISLWPNSGLETDSPFGVNLFVEGWPKDSDATNLTTWDPGCTSTINWATKPITIGQFFQQCEKPLANQPTFNFPVSISHLEEYYVNQDGMCVAGFSIERM